MDANKNEKQKDLKLMNWALKFASSAGLVGISYIVFPSSLHIKSLLHL